jgi:regulator of protease activity HflC (stomatin/prohibitin superfamily)
MGNAFRFFGMTAIAAIAVVLVTFFFFMHSETVEPGYHGVVVDKPYFFGHEGVRQQPIIEGRAILFKTSAVIPVRVTPQSIQIGVDDYSTSDNIFLDFQTTIQYQITDPVELVRNFGVDWFKINVERQYLSVVRESVKKRTMSDMISSVSESTKVDDEVTRGLVSLVKESKLPVKILGVSLGRAQPNKEVLAQMNETAAQQQRFKTLEAAERAEQKRRDEQIAKANADNAYRNAIGMNAEQFIALEHIKRWTEACAKAATCVINPNGQVLNIAGHSR